MFKSNFLSALDIYLMVAIASGIVGYYLGHRGFTGVLSDLNDVKKDLEFVKGKISSQETK